MKILPVFQNRYINNNYNYWLHKNVNIQTKDIVSFSSVISDEERYQKAQVYADKFKKYWKYTEAPKINEFNYDKLEGLQYGIPVFDGMTMKQILFSLQVPYGICVTRGCNSNCGHCGPDAKPPRKEDKMLYEDFEALMTGIKELSDRLHFPVVKDDIVSLFYDSDSIKTISRDKDGKLHDFIDLNNTVVDCTGKKGNFDTAGWFSTDAVSQILAEKYCKYFSNPKNMDKIGQFNISFHPFSALRMKELEYRKLAEQTCGKDKGIYLQKAQNFHDKAVEMTANALYTFTPLTKFDNFSIIGRYIDNPDFTDFSVDAYEDLRTDVLNALKKKYWDDFKSENPKIITKRTDVKKYLNKYYKLMEPDLSESMRLVPVGRLEKLIERITGFSSASNKSGQRFISLNNPTILDSNGKVYLYNNDFTISPTEFQFNFKNKNHETAAFSPNLRKTVYKSENLDDLLS